MKSMTFESHSPWIAALAITLGACGGESAAEGAGDSPSTGSGVDLPPVDEGSTSDGVDGGIGSEGSADETTGEGLPNTCGASMFTLEHQPTNVVLVLDKSFSMVDNLWDHDNDEASEVVTRWNSLHRSVTFIIDEFDDGLNFGSVLFPSTEVPDNEWETACLVGLEPDAPVAPNNGEQVLAALPGPDELELFGGTPASEGISTALNHLRSLDPSVPRAMIFITDGAANCQAGTTDSEVFNVYDENLSGLVSEAFEQEDIPTYVVGIDIVDEIVNIPQDNPFIRLNEVAEAGGFPQPGDEKFHNAQDEDELRSAISQITSQIGCTIPLDMPPDAPDLLSIVIDGAEVPYVESCEGAESGWTYVSPEGPYDEVELCDSSCDALHNIGNLSAHYGCIPAG